MPRGLFLFLLAVHQLSNDFCHKEKQHANSAPLPFISPSPLLTATTLLFLLPIPPLLNADQPWHFSFALSLLLGGGNCIFPIQTVIWGGSFFLLVLFPLWAVGQDLMHRHGEKVTEIRPG